ncbi:MAG: hypothetical protein ACR2IV_05565 [Bryobacteraceae bacterium]
MLLTWFLQRAIIGIEAYIPTAAFMAAVHYGRMNPALIKAVKDPSVSSVRALPTRSITAFLLWLIRSSYAPSSGINLEENPQVIRRGSHLDSMVHNSILKATITPQRSTPL